MVNYCHFIIPQIAEPIETKCGDYILLVTEHTPINKMIRAK